jgi:hypothetical protein
MHSINKRNYFVAICTLRGLQAVLEPITFGYCLSALITDVGPDLDLIDELEFDRDRLLEWAITKLKNPKRSVCKPQPWELVDDCALKIKFSWKETTKPFLMDCNCKPIDTLPFGLIEGSVVRIAFYQKPYILKDGVTHGTSLKLIGIQVIRGAPVDKPRELDFDDVAELFGKRNGFIAK